MVIIILIHCYDYFVRLVVTCSLCAVARLSVCLSVSFSLSLSLFVPRPPERRANVGASATFRTIKAGGAAATSKAKKLTSAAAAAFRLT